MRNVYLERLTANYKALMENVTGIQTRATEANRDLTPEEVKAVEEQAAEMTRIATQIEQLTAVEVRNAKVREMTARVSSEVDNMASQGTATLGDGFGKVGGAQTRDRDPGHYTRASQHSFFKDLTDARQHGNTEAARRLVEHNRAIDTTGEGAGVVAPKWLTEEYAEIARQGRALANVVRNIPIGDDPRPLTLPKQTGGTDAAVDEQASEGDSISSVDGWDSSTDVVVPRPTAGSQNVTRQMLDMSSPGIDQLIYADLLGAYNDKLETRVGAAILATGSALPAIEGAGVDITDPDHFARIALRAAVAVRKARKQRANLLVMSVDRHADFLDLLDTSGRPLIPEDSAGLSNVMGVGSVMVDGRYRGLGMIATEGIADDTTFAAIRSNDILLFESNMLRFRYEEPAGPELIRLGVWAYTAVLVRYGTAPVKKVTVTEESV